MSGDSNSSHTGLCMREDDIPYPSIQWSRPRTQHGLHHRYDAAILAAVRWVWTHSAMERQMLQNSSKLFVTLQLHHRLLLTIAVPHFPLASTAFHNCSVSLFTPAYRPFPSIVRTYISVASIAFEYRAVHSTSMVYSRGRDKGYISSQQNGGKTHRLN